MMYNQPVFLLRVCSLKKAPAFTLFLFMCVYSCQVVYCVNRQIKISEEMALPALTLPLPRLYLSSCPPSDFSPSDPHLLLWSKRKQTSTPRAQRAAAGVHRRAQACACAQAGAGVHRHAHVHRRAQACTGVHRQAQACTGVRTCTGVHRQAQACTGVRTCTRVPATNKIHQTFIIFSVYSPAFRREQVVYGHIHGLGYRSEADAGASEACRAHRL